MKLYEFNPLWLKRNIIRRAFRTVLLIFCLLINVTNSSSAKQKGYFINSNLPSIETSDLISYNSAIENIDISGRVVDEQGLPIPGASVKVKGGKQTYITDANGSFNIKNVSESAVLVVFYIGYEPQEVSAANKMTVELVSSNTGLNEVIVVGYGTQKKGSVTSAVSQVSRKEIASTPGASLQNLLTGKATGLTTLQRSGVPGGDAANIFIRGVNTLPGFDTSPLILVDDIKYEYNQFARIDVNEIESISLLKDAAATSIYGIEGANGVVLVTTRRGKFGKPVINFKTEGGFNFIITPIKPLGAYDAAVLRNEALTNDGLPLEFTQQDLDHFKAKDDPFGHPDVNWYDVFYNKSSLQVDNNLDISGGTERVKYFASIGYLFQNGLLNDVPYKGAETLPDQSEINKNYYFKRYKFRSNIDLNATPKLKFSLDFSGTFGETNTAQANSLAGSLTQYEYVNQYAYPLYNPDGSFGYGNPNHFQPRDALNNIGAIVSLGGYNRNFNNFINTKFTIAQDLSGITKGLSIKGILAYSNNNDAKRSLTRDLTKIASYYYNPVDGSYTPRDPNITRIQFLSASYSGGNPAIISTMQAVLNYDSSFGKNNVSGLLLYNRKSEVDNKKSHENLPGNFEGYTFRGSYNYDKKYLFEFSGAYNGSSRFTTQNRYKLFPAVSLGWNIANETFFKNNLPFMEQFKLRGSFGYSGTDDIGNFTAYSYESFYSNGFNYNFGETPNSFGGIYENQIGNDDVRWATERKANIGLEFSFFKGGKLSGSIDYFNNYRYDILLKRTTIPLSYGVPKDNLPPVNLGEVSNNGFEFSLNHRSKIGKVGIDVRANFSYAKNTILYQDEVQNFEKPWLNATGKSVGLKKKYIWTGEYYTQQEVDDPNTIKPIGEIRAGWLKYEDLDGNGIINVDDMAFTGAPNVPTTVIGLNMGFNYKGFSFNMLWQANLNAESFASFDLAVPFKTQLQSIHQDRWTPETANTATFPALTTLFSGTYMSPSGNLSTFWSTKTDYIRLRSAEISYSFPDKIANRFGLGGLRIYANGYNLYTFSNFFKRFAFDPEIVDGQGSVPYPTTRLLNTGISITFK
jgi:TonB-linked SusC/RagA family outer membrane protein